MPNNSIKIINHKVIIKQKFPKLQWISHLSCEIKFQTKFEFKQMEKKWKIEKEEEKKAS